MVSFIYYLQYKICPNLTKGRILSPTGVKYSQLSLYTRHGKGSAKIDRAQKTWMLGAVFFGFWNRLVPTPRDRFSSVRNKSGVGYCQRVGWVTGKIQHHAKNCDLQIQFGKWTFLTSTFQQILNLPPGKFRSRARSYAASHLNYNYPNVLDFWVVLLQLPKRLRLLGSVKPPW